MVRTYSYLSFNTLAAWYPLRYFDEGTALNHRDLQFPQDGRVVILAAHIWAMDPRTPAWTKAVETMAEHKILRKAYRQYAQLREFDHNYLALVIYDEVVTI